MKNLKNSLDNDFWNWLDSISIKYKNYEIKNAIIVDKFYQYIQIMHNISHFNLKKILSYIKWKLKLILLSNKIPNLDIVLKRNYDSIYDFSNKNLYVINYSPNEAKRNFLHIAPLAENDKNSLVITIKKDVFEYFDRLGIKSILINIYNPWINIRDLKVNTPNIKSKKSLLLSLEDIFSLVSLSRAASLIDLLDVITGENGLPQTLITLQDILYTDSVFAAYYSGKIPTVTLQHGKATIQNKDQKNLWKYLISDWMIVFGSHQAEILESLGVNSKKIKVLGTAKYDIYMDRIDGKLKNNRNKRVLFGIQQAMFFKENNEIIFDFIKKLLSSKEDYKVSIRFHPAITKKNRKKFSQKLKKLNLTYGMKIDISNIEDPLEDISESMVVFTSKTTLAMEAIMLGKPVIEYLSSNSDDCKKIVDYRDFVLHAPTGEDAEALIIKLLNNKFFYNEIVEKQNNFINSEIMSPPAIPRILNFINSLNNNRRSVKNKL